MSKLDRFTEKRITQFVEQFRAQSGQLPTLQNFKSAGFLESQIDLSLKSNVLEKFYVTLNNGSIVKGFKVKQLK